MFILLYLTEVHSKCAKLDDIIGNNIKYLDLCFGCWIRPIFQRGNYKQPCVILILPQCHCWIPMTNTWPIYSVIHLQLISCEVFISTATVSQLCVFWWLTKSFDWVLHDIMKIWKVQLEKRYCTNLQEIQYCIALHI